jgi:glycosyltransferase involved in cell wall biosynthesis
MQPPRAQRLLVVIPAHNEKGRIGPVIRAARAALPAADIAVVNDDSTDATGLEALRAGAAVLPHATNLGYGAALETGYLYALSNGYDAVLQMDGDGQHRASELPAILAPVAAGDADLVLGSRYAGGASAYCTPLVKRLGQRLFAFILRLFTGRRFTDPTSGFQALGPRAIRFFASGVFPCDYPDADVLLMAYLAGLRIEEKPVRMDSRPSGASMHSGWKPMYYGMKMLLSIFIVLLNYPLWRQWRAELNRPAEEPR